MPIVGSIRTVNKRSAAVAFDFVKQLGKVVVCCRHAVVPCADNSVGTFGELRHITGKTAALFEKVALFAKPVYVVYKSHKSVIEGKRIVFAVFCRKEVDKLIVKLAFDCFIFAKLFGKVSLDRIGNIRNFTVVYPCVVIEQLGKINVAF